MKKLFLAWLFVAGVIAPARSAPQIEIWHGTEQTIGHLGISQDDFNILGRVLDPTSLQSVSYSLNGGPPIPLSTSRYRRIAQAGDFNADIAIKDLKTGPNTVLIAARDKNGGTAEDTITINKVSGGSYPLPVSIDWSEVSDPGQVGQYVDGKWGLQNGGLEVLRTGYDRMFLIGERTWKDFEVTVPVTIISVDPETSPVSGQNAIGIVLRFTGHIVGGHRNFPDVQPKWGYQPFGGLGWLRFRPWSSGSEPSPDPEFANGEDDGWTNAEESASGRKFSTSLEFYNGENDSYQGFGTYEISEGATYIMKMRCETLPDTPDGKGVTRYSYKIWRQDQPEPSAWSWQKVWTGEYALRTGGVALLAHHVSARFGNVSVIDLEKPAQEEVPATSQPCAHGSIVGETLDEIVIDGQSCYIESVVVNGDIRVSNSEYVAIVASEVKGSIRVGAGSFALIASNRVGGKEGSVGSVVINNLSHATVLLNVVNGSMQIANNEKADVKSNSVSGDLVCTDNFRLNLSKNQVEGGSVCRRTGFIQ